ncbi:NAD(P)-binding protein [Lentinus tigrinus ALCF2SS1-7]|uniref:NAD(P)-binding protein n=1 Tax=Lentinus tigrinus ALCF2SS1-6 TaxID=1328759 RepID=A0A5C2S2A1_9APHY|nr:NAD(P)-binding protein [Lentinus tigrinus ALCF2SS1-6]RPD78759.1 NAD(P)-binding protein [Lentinus tigrinus ALCF2SS1-7]
MSSTSNITGTVAILGGTGDLGLHMSRIFLIEYRKQFPVVRITTRDPNSPKAQELAKLGAELYKASDSFDEVLSGVDVVINALPTFIPEEARKQLLAALVRADPKVYFLSEFGADWRLNEFDGYEHKEWRTKRVVTAETKAALQGTRTKLIMPAIGLFLGWLFHPGLGIDIEKNVYTPLGSERTRVATTAEDDIARSVARLAILSLDPATASTVPTDLRIAGQNVSYEEIPDAVSRVKGVPNGAIKTLDLEEFDRNLKENPNDNLLDYIRVLIGQGKMDFSRENANELVNPNQSLWKWKTVEDQLRSSESP